MPLPSYSRLDNNMVQDDQGNQYYMPIPGSSNTPAAPSPALSPEEVPATPQILPSQEETNNPLIEMPAEPPSDFKLAGGDSEVAKLLGSSPEPTAATRVSMIPQARTAQKQSVAQARQGAIAGDLTGFSAGGGVLKDQSDLAAAAGGIAKTEQEAQLLELESSRLRKAAQAQANARKAETLELTADEYASRLDTINADAKDRADKWNKAYEEHKKRMAQPAASFSTRSTFSQAMWILSFLAASQTKNSQANLGLVMNMLDKTIQRDIDAQKAGLQASGQNLDRQATANDKAELRDRQELKDWTLAEAQRYAALEKAIDAKIAAVGAPQAEAAGLLRAKAAIASQVMKTQQTAQAQIESDRQRRAREAHDIYMERLKRQWKREDDAVDFEQQKELKRLDAGLKEDQKIDTIPTGTGFGLNLVDKSTGKKVEGQIRLAPGVKGEKAIEAKRILSTGNAEASMLAGVRKDLETMSDADLIRGGSPAFKQKVFAFMNAKIKEQSGATVTPQEAFRQFTEEFGFDITGNSGLLATAAAAGRSVGDLKSGVIEAVDQNLRNLASRTENRLLPYLNSDDIQRFSLVWDPQSIEVEKPKGEQGLNSSVAELAGPGVDVKDLQTRTRRSPVKTNEEAAAAEPGLRALAGAGIDISEGQPRLEKSEATLLEQVKKELKSATPEDAEKLGEAVTRRKDLSPEARLQIAVEVYAQTERAKQLEAEAVKKTDQVLRKRFNNPYVDPSEDETRARARELVGNPVFEEFRRRAGLVKRKAD